MKPIIKNKQIPEYQPPNSYGANWAIFETKDISILKKKGKLVKSCYCPDCCGHKFELKLIKTKLSLFGLIQTDIYEYVNIAPEHIDAYKMKSEKDGVSIYCGNCGHLLSITR